MSCPHRRAALLLLYIVTDKLSLAVYAIAPLLLRFAPLAVLPRVLIPHPP